MAFRQAVCQGPQMQSQMLCPTADIACKLTNKHVTSMNKADAKLRQAQTMTLPIHFEGPCNQLYTVVCNLRHIISEVCQQDMAARYQRCSA